MGARAGSGRIAVGSGHRPTTDVGPGVSCSWEDVDSHARPHGPWSHLDGGATGRHADCVDDQYDDRALALLALYDIRRDVARIAEALADGEEEEEDDEDA